MAHEVFGNRIMLREKPAWHGLGTVFTEPLSVSEAFVKGGINVRYRKEPQFVEVNGEQQQSGQYAIVRDPTHDDPEERILGYVLGNYELLQNMDLARIIDPWSSKWPVESAGLLKKGADVFVALNAGRKKLVHDEAVQYLTIANNHTGQKQILVYLTPVLTVCMNTMIAGQASATTVIKIRHEGDLEKTIERAIRTVAVAERSYEELFDLFEALAGYQTSFDEVERAINAAFPLPREPEEVIRVESMSLGARLAYFDAHPEAEKKLAKKWADYERRLREAQLYRNATAEYYANFERDFPNHAGTAWHAYMAITEAADWTKEETPARAQSVLLGDLARSKARAFDTLVGYLN